jgi:hypothetical protein
MNEKVMLPKEVAEAIEDLKSGTWTQANLLNAGEFVRVANPERLEVDESHSAYPIAKFLSKDFHDNYPRYVSALVNGYEVEQTPEDNLRVYYEGMKKTVNHGHFGTERARSIMEGVEKTLDILGITIADINA